MAKLPVIFGPEIAPKMMTKIDQKNMNNVRQVRPPTRPPSVFSQFSLKMALTANTSANTRQKEDNIVRGYSQRPPTPYRWWRMADVVLSRCFFGQLLTFN
jgi:hypothetical protein